MGADAERTDEALNVLDLFSGIGGFSLGFERAGMRTVAFCELDRYCRQVLAQRFPEVDCYHDVEELDAGRLVRAHGPIDVICGGFPCQDVSLAGSGAGLAGARSGLWRHFVRLIRELRPRWVVIENVSALRSRGLGTVLGDLAAIGYDAEWHCIPASYVGAPHRRDRIWIVAHHAGIGRHAWHARHARQGIDSERRRHESRSTDCDVADARRELLEGRQGEPAEGATQWSTEPDVGRVAHGVPHRVDRLKALGNSIVPQIAEMIGRAIMAQEND